MNKSVLNNSKIVISDKKNFCSCPVEFFFSNLLDRKDFFSLWPCLKVKLYFQVWLYHSQHLVFQVWLFPAAKFQYLQWKGIAFTPYFTWLFIILGNFLWNHSIVLSFFSIWKWFGGTDTMLPSLKTTLQSVILQSIL